ncbi:hypothetical protein DFH29DRAFT_581883 [Suillus ampliporus]|nr:hypothetical protein DFH29DRAFT_581883 [Suillus ampliporus]
MLMVLLSLSSIYPTCKGGDDIEVVLALIFPRTGYSEGLEIREGPLVPGMYEDLRTHYLMLAEPVSFRSTISCAFKPSPTHVSSTAQELIQ